MKDPNCDQCMHPDHKGLHTCERGLPRSGRVHITAEQQRAAEDAKEKVRQEEFYRQDKERMFQMLSNNLTVERVGDDVVVRFDGRVVCRS